MPIKWNKVTWYSKIAALALFVVLPCSAFYMGMLYGDSIRGLQDQLALALSQSQVPQVPTAPSISAVDPYADQSTWVNASLDRSGFTMAYPADFPASEIPNTALGTDWRMNAGDAKGSTALTLTIPKSFQPNTNFSEAKLTVGLSGDTKAVKNCLTDDPSGGPASAGVATINGVPFYVARTSDAGAGNFYDTTSYRAVYEGKCYAIEYTIHSTNIDNYPPERHITAFDAQKVKNLMDRIVQTFKFL